jgi:hypothetical protein
LRQKPVVPKKSQTTHDEQAGGTVRKAPTLNYKTFWWSTPQLKKTRQFCHFKTFREKVVHSFAESIGKRNLKLSRKCRFFYYFHIHVTIILHIFVKELSQKSKPKN